MDTRTDQHIVEKAVKLSLVEVVIGSAVHAIHLPFGGHILSLNQGFFLTRYLADSNSRFSAAKMVMEVSSVTSVMKALSPIGKKLGPMISISMQGFLYMLGVLLLGAGLAGSMLGMALMSVWAFIQPLVTYFVIYGSDLASAIAYFSKKQEGILEILYWVIAGKAILAASIPLMLRFISSERIERLENKIASMSVPKREKKQRGVLAELFRPGFVLSLVLMMSFFYISGDDAIVIFWKCLRALAIAFVIFFLARNSYVHRLAGYLASKNKVFRRIYELSQNAISQISNLK
tara:strand:+ start:6809 stop:7678 length:870 start_codon:yes stop_codon:yes gene_type:complete